MAKRSLGAFMQYKRLAKAALLASVLVALVSGCASTVVGRYKECRDQQGNNCRKHIPDVDVSVVFSPAPKPAAKTGADLTERAQAAYHRCVIREKQNRLKIYGRISMPGSEMALSRHYGA